MASNSSGGVETVLGRVPLSQLGEILTHEHLVSDFTKLHIFPRYENVSAQNYLDWLNSANVRQYPYSNYFNLTLKDQPSLDVISREVSLFKECGGKTIVENTSYGLERNISEIKKISSTIGINVIVGTGFYVAAVQNTSSLRMNTEDMYNRMLDELDKGCIDNQLHRHDSIKAGFIGEVASTWPIASFEKRAIMATGELQEQLHCPVSFTPGPNLSAPANVLRIYQEAGGKSRNVVMSNIDRTFFKKMELMEFMDETDCYIQFDMFGTECSFYQLNKFSHILSDAQRIRRIASLKKEKQLHRVFMSHDIHTKHKLVAFGGHGFAHITKNIVPVMIDRGFTPRDIKLLRVKNPRKWLTRQ